MTRDTAWRECIEIIHSAPLARLRDDDGTEYVARDSLIAEIRSRALARSGFDPDADALRDGIAALARELAACRLALLNERTDKEAAQQEAAHLRRHRTATMAQALRGTTYTDLSMFMGAQR